MSLTFVNKGSGSIFGKKNWQHCLLVIAVFEGFLVVKNLKTYMKIAQGQLNAGRINK